MKLVYKNIGHILRFDPGYVVELVIENKTLFREVVNNISMQIDGQYGDAVLSVRDKPVELSKYADLTVQLIPFQVNRKSLLTKLYSSLEQKSLSAEYYPELMELLGRIDKFIHSVAEEYSFDICCQKISLGPILRSVGVEIAVDDLSTLEKIFEYMELVRELDKDRLFIFVNFRTYFSDNDVDVFVKTVYSHDFKVLFLESSSFVRLNNVKRYTVDEDLCEF